MYFTNYDSPLGEMLIASDGEAVYRVCFYGQKHFPSSDFIRNDDLAIFGQVKQWLDDYFEGLNPEIDFEVKLEGYSKELEGFRKREVMTTEEMKNNVEKLNELSKNLDQALVEFEVWGLGMGTYDCTALLVLGYVFS